MFDGSMYDCETVAFLPDCEGLVNRVDLRVDLAGCGGEVPGVYMTL